MVADNVSQTSVPTYLTIATFAIGESPSWCQLVELKNIYEVANFLKKHKSINVVGFAFSKRDSSVIFQRCERSELIINLAEKLNIFQKPFAAFIDNTKREVPKTNLADVKKKRERKKLRNLLRKTAKKSNCRQRGNNLESKPPNRLKLAS